MKEKELLERLGLRNPLSQIYLSLLGRDGVTVGELARISGIYRPSIYKALPLLLGKELISKSRRGKRIVYFAETPEFLSHEIENMQTEFSESLPELLARFSSGKRKPAIRFFEGKNGIAHAYEELLVGAKKDDVIYRYESPKDHYLMKKYYPKLYWEKATGPKSLVQKYVITNEKTHKLRHQNLNRYSKMIPASYDGFDYDMSQLIFRNKVVFIDFQSETASIIENKAFAEFQKKIFKLLFKFL